MGGGDDWEWRAVLQDLEGSGRILTFPLQEIESHVGCEKSSAINAFGLLQDDSVVQGTGAGEGAC